VTDFGQRARPRARWHSSARIPRAEGMIYNFIRAPDWMSSTSTFHSAGCSTARLPASPMRTSSPAISTSGQAMHCGHSDILIVSMTSSIR
jgi:hypothetical protein